MRTASAGSKKRPAPVPKKHPKKRPAPGASKKAASSSGTKKGAPVDIYAVGLEDDLPVNPVYERICWAAEASGLKMRELCRLAGVHRHALYRCRAEPTARLSLETLMKFSQVTGFDVDYFANGGRKCPRDTRYRNRQRAMASARRMGFSQAAIDSLLQINPSCDQPERWWLSAIVRADDELGKT